MWWAKEARKFRKIISHTPRLRDAMACQQLPEEPASSMNPSGPYSKPS